MSGPAKCGICGDMSAPSKLGVRCPRHGGPEFIIADDGHVRLVTPGPAITQGPDDAGDGAALRDAAKAKGEFLDVFPLEVHHVQTPERPTLNRHAGELAIELMRYASANGHGASLARPLTAYETHYAGHIAAFLHHGFRQAVKALEGDDAGAAEALKLAMQSARSADAARKVVQHEDRIREAQS